MMPDNSHTWEERGGWVVKQLAKDLGLTLVAAAGIVGNLGFESMGFTKLREIGQPEGRGGYGWAQWTADRHKSFLAYAASKNLDWQSDEANYGYLLEELRGPYKNLIKQLLGAQTVSQATWIVGQVYERPGGTTESFLPGNAGRTSYAQRAYNGAQDIPAMSTATASGPQVDPITLAVKTLQRALMTGGFNPGLVDGIPGPQTLKALEDWRRG